MFMSVCLFVLENVGFPQAKQKKWWAFTKPYFFIFSRFQFFSWPTFLFCLLHALFLQQSDRGSDDVGLTGCGVGFIALHRERDSFKG